MRIQSVELKYLDIPMIEPLVAAHGTVLARETVFVRVVGDGSQGWGECVALNEPTYAPDWSGGEFATLRDVLIPALLDREEIGAGDVMNALGAFKQHHPAKAALEMAVLDSELRSTNRSFAQYLRMADQPMTAAKSVEAIVVVGLFEGDTLLRIVQRHVDAGYRHLKLKIAPGMDIGRVDIVQGAFPSVRLSVDANGSYLWKDPDHRKGLLMLDERGLEMIEQPLSPRHLKPLADLRQHMRTPIALDESIDSWESAHNAVDFDLCDVLTIKPGLVGGYLTARRLHDECRGKAVSLALGGMIETGLARSANLALAALPGFQSRPAEVSPDGRWFTETLTKGTVDLVDGSMEVPEVAGIGAGIDEDVLDRLTRYSHLIRRGS